MIELYDLPDLEKRGMQREVRLSYDIKVTGEIIDYEVVISSRESKFDIFDLSYVKQVSYHSATKGGKSTRENNRFYNILFRPLN